MEHEVNKSEELSTEDLIKEIRSLDSTMLRVSLNKLSVEKKLDLLDFLHNKFSGEIFLDIFESILLSHDSWILKMYFNTIYPWEQITNINFTVDLEYVLYRVLGWYLTGKLKDISIPKLRQINNQLKLWWVTKEVASSVAKFKKIQLSLLEIEQELAIIPENTLKNPLVMQEIWENEKIIKKLLSWLREKKDLFNSDLWQLEEKMWWHLHYSWRSPITTGTIQIRDKENKLVEIWWKNSQFQTFKCVYSSDPETIALSELGWITLKFVDESKKDNEITWYQIESDSEKRQERYHDYIDSVMYDLVNTILKKWFSWKIGNYQNKYFILLTESWLVFFDDKWNELSDEEGNKEFDKKFDYEIVEWKVVKKELKKPDNKNKERMSFLFRNHRG